MNCLSSGVGALSAPMLKPNWSETIDTVMQHKNKYSVHFYLNNRFDRDCIGMIITMMMMTNTQCAILLGCFCGSSWTRLET